MRTSSPPPSPRGSFARIVAFSSDLAGYATLAAVLGSMLIITYEVMARYVYQWPTIWEIEASVFLLIFITFVGSAYALKHDKHITMDVLTLRLKPRTRQKLDIATGLGGLAFCVLASVKAWLMWWEAFSLGWRSDSIWSPPLALPYSFLALGLSLISLQYLAIIMDKFHNLRDRGQRWSPESSSSS